MLGPQGSGKGTQAARLAKFLKLPMAGSGALYRSHIEQETAIGLEAKEYLAQGHYAPDALTNQLIEETLAEPMYTAGIILDGYPRTLPQKEFLDKLIDDYEVVYLDITDGEAIERISGRTQCANGHVYHRKYNPPKEEGVCDIDELKLTRRQDDTPEFVRSRLNAFHEKTEPLLSAYQADGTIQVISAEGDIESVFEKVKSAVTNDSH